MLMNPNRDMPLSLSDSLIDASNNASGSVASTPYAINQVHSIAVQAQSSATSAACIATAACTAIGTHDAISASTTQKGHVQLCNSYSSTYTNMAATPYAVKMAYDKAVEAASSGGNCALATTLNTELHGSNNFTVGTNCVIGNNATNAIAIGVDVRCNGDQSIAIGAWSFVGNNAKNAVCLRGTASADTDSAFVVGGMVRANTYGATAIKGTVESNSNYATAIGFGTYVKPNSIGGIAMGYTATANGGCSLAIGHTACITSAANYSVAIGYAAKVSNANTFQLGCASAVSTFYVAKSPTVGSDERDKTDIEDLHDATEFLKKIRAVTYVFNYRDDYQYPEENLDKESKEKRDKYGLYGYDKEAHAAGTKKGERKRSGVLAQEVQRAMVEVYGTDNYADIVMDNLYDEDPSTIPEDVESQLGVNYTAFIPFLIKAVQELSSSIEELKKENQELKSMIQ